LEVGELTATLRVDDDGYRQKLDDASQAWQSTANRIGAIDPAAKIEQSVGRLTSTLGLQQRSLAIMEDELGKVTEKYKEGSIQARRKELALDSLRGSLLLLSKSWGSWASP
jgi:tagatose-1,6-bisphosphate aldolase non-catalytic subunit AgaZ/GatZ